MRIVGTAISENSDRVSYTWFIEHRQTISTSAKVAKTIAISPRAPPVPSHRSPRPLAQ